MLHHLKTLAHPPRLLLVGSFGAGNSGDELLLAGFLTRLRKTLPTAKITITTGNAKLTRAWHGANITTVPLLPCGFRSFFGTNWFATLRAIRRADAVIFPGGGLFTDEESLRAVFLWAIHLLVARFLWKPVYLFGQSVGPFRTSCGKKLAAAALTRAELVVTRDAVSVEELRTLGVNSKKISVDGDSALSLPRLNMKPRVKQPQRILLAVRDYPRLGENVWREIGKRIDDALARDACVTFAAWGVGDDDAVAKLKPYCRHFKKITRAKLPVGARPLIEFIRKHDLVLGIRLHSLIAAHLAGVPSLGFAYSRKVSEFQKSVKQPVIEGTQDQTVSKSKSGSFFIRKHH